MAKILFAASVRLGHGGVESHLLSLLPEVARHHDVLLLSGATKEFRCALRAAGIRWLEWGASHVGDRAARKRLSDVVAAESPDILHVQDARAAEIARVFLPRPRPLLAYTVHLAPYHYRGWGGWRDRVLPWIYAQVERVLNFCCTARVIYISRRDYDEALRRHLVPLSKAVFLPNGIDLADFPAPLLPERREPLLCAVARLSPEKGVDVLLHAFAIALPDLPRNVRLKIVGDGDLRDELEHLADVLGIATRVEFAGFLSPERVRDCLRHSAAFVLLSRHEGRSLAVMEAQATGLPVIATAVGDNPFMVSERNGFLVPPEDPKAAARGMVELFRRRAEWAQMQKAALAQAQNYDVHRQVAGILSLYDELLRVAAERQS